MVSIKRSIVGFLKKFMDLLYPPALYCCCCGNIIDTSCMYELCNHCLVHVKWDEHLIRSIRGMKFLSCTQYGIYERTMIFSLKYNKKTYIAADIAAIMEDKLEAAGETDFDVIVPVPMFEKKEKERGFNQAAVIAKYLTRRMGKTYVHALIRTEDTKPMRGLNPTEREINVKGKFQLTPYGKRAISGKKVLLVDDFSTTGSTALACVSQLAEGNPSDICFLAFASKM